MSLHNGPTLFATYHAPHWYFKNPHFPGYRRLGVSVASASFRKEGVNLTLLPRAEMVEDRPWAVKLLKLPLPPFKLPRALLAGLMADLGVGARWTSPSEFFMVSSPWFVSSSSTYFSVLEVLIPCDYSALFTLTHSIEHLCNYEGLPLQKYQNPP